MTKTTTAALAVVIAVAATSRAMAQGALSQPAGLTPTLQLAPPPATLPPPPVAVDAPDAPHHIVCVEGRPHECDAVFLLEAGFHGGTQTAWVYDFGVLFNHGHNAYGLTMGGLAYTRSDGMNSMYESFTARYRRYLGERGAAVDLSLGTGKYGESAEIAFGYRDIIAVSAVAFTASDDADRPIGGTVGIRIGTEAILAIAAVLANAHGGG